MNPIELFLNIGRTMNIVHHVPGRIRLRFSTESLPLLKQFGDIDPLQEKDVQAILSAIPGINHVKINQMVGSATIEYDKQDWSSQLWESLCNGVSEPILNEKVGLALEALGVDLEVQV